MASLSVWSMLSVNAGAVVRGLDTESAKPTDDTEILESSEPIGRVFIALGANRTLRHVAGEPELYRGNDGKLVIVIPSGLCAKRKFANGAADLHPDSSPTAKTVWVNAVHGVSVASNVVDSDIASI